MARLFDWIRRNARMLIPALLIAWLLLVAAILSARAYGPADPVEPNKLSLGFSIVLALVLTWGVLPLAGLQAFVTVVAWRESSVWHRAMGALPGTIILAIWGYFMLFTKM